ncbi:MAG: polysaccharide biosynthesis tyrosine autokinase [bacterium]|nr:polysaccharide biosynthesis tyrosine autokinase [bacterium]
MEIAQYIRLLRKWAWLIILAAFIGGGISFVLGSQRVPFYSAQSLVLVGRYIDTANPTGMDINIGFSLVQTYSELVKTPSIAEGVVESLQLDILPENIIGAVTTTVRDGTSLLEINVTWTDPVLATDIANELAEQLVLQSPTNLTQDQQEQVNFLSGQIEALNNTIQELRVQIQQVDAQLEATTDSAEIIRLTERRSTIVDQINDASGNIAEYSNNITTIRERTNSIEIRERARLAYQVAGASSTSTFVGIAVGAALALAFALGIEYLDDRIRNTEEAVTTIGLPVFGAIMRFGKRSDRYGDRLLARLPPMSPIAEGYRNLRTNLLYNTQDVATKKPIYIITSPGPEEGKSLTSANIAISMAMAGLRVLLIDADLRRPKVHEIFGLDNQVGMTTLLFAEPDSKDITTEDPNVLSGKLRQCLQDTFVPELRVITSGFTPSNPSELLGSSLMKRWMDIFRQATNVDVIVVDTPPCLVVADSTVLAATIDANVVLVVNSEKTRRAAAVRARAQFEQLGVKINGVVLNQVNPQEETYGYGYSAYYYYSPNDASVQAPRGLRRLFAGRGKPQ